MRRRKFITLLGGTALAWPRVARAQTSGTVRTIGVLMGFPSTHTEAQNRLATFRKTLEEIGWVEDRNVRIEVRWAGTDFERGKVSARELVALAPDVIFCSPSTALAELSYLTRTIPIVFVGVSDPVGSGFVSSLSRPGGNITGFSSFEPAMAGKWLEILKEIAPGVTRVAVLLRPETHISPPMWRAIGATASALSIEATAASVRDSSDIEQAVATVAGRPGGGLVVLPNPVTVSHRDLIIELAARHRLPAIYPFRYFATSNGLAYYGINLIEQSARAAGYVDRILKGAKPADLPIQAPTKFELVINLTTAKQLGLKVPSTVLARADEVIE